VSDAASVEFNVERHAAEAGSDCREELSDSERIMRRIFERAGSSGFPDMLFGCSFHCVTVPRRGMG